MKSKTERSDRRGERRIALEAQIGIAVVQWPLSIFRRRPQFQAALRDASNSGMLCLVGKAVKPSSVVRLWVEVDLNHRRTLLRLTGTVLWCRPDEKSRSHLLGIRLDPRPAKAAQEWLRVMVDELRLREGASPM